MIKPKPHHKPKPKKHHRGFVKGAKKKAPLAKKLLLPAIKD